MKKPQPKTVKVVCTVCGLDWEAHKAEAGKEPTLENCVALLKTELAKKPLPQIWSGSAVTSPNVSYLRPANEA